MSPLSCYDKRYYKSGAEFFFDLKVSIPCSLVIICAAFYFILDLSLFVDFHGGFNKEGAAFSFLFLYMVYLSLNAPVMFFEGRRSILFIKVYQGRWMLAKDYSGKDARWGFEDISVSKTPPFPFWKRCLYRTSLLSKKNSNYQLVEKRTGRIYVANGDYFSDCLDNLINMKS